MGLKDFRSIEAYKQDEQFFRQEYGRLVREYPDQYVAVHEGKVLESASDLDALRARLQKKKISLTTPYIGFVNARKAPPAEE